MLSNFQKVEPHLEGLRKLNADQFDQKQGAPRNITVISIDQLVYLTERLGNVMQRQGTISEWEQQSFEQGSQLEIFKPNLNLGNCIAINLIEANPKFAIGVLSQILGQELQLKKAYALQSFIILSYTTKNLDRDSKNGDIQVFISFMFMPEIEYLNTVMLESSTELLSHNSLAALLATLYCAGKMSSQEYPRVTYFDEQDLLDSDKVRAKPEIARKLKPYERLPERNHCASFTIMTPSTRNSSMFAPNSSRNMQTVNISVLSNRTNDLKATPVMKC